MFTSLISKINTVLGGITSVKVVFDYPETKLTGFPAVVFFPNTFSNEYYSSDENAKTYNFTIFVLQETKVATQQAVFQRIMPNTLDDIIQAFDESWSQGSNVDGNRIWWTLSSGSWVVVQGQNGEMVQAELNLQIKCNTTI